MEVIESSSRNKGIVMQIIYSFLIKIVSVAINFFYVPMLLDLFNSKEEYGIWLTVSSIVTWFAIFDIGLGNGLRNKLTEALADENYKLSKKLVSTTYITTFLLFSFLGILFVVINPYLNWNSILNSNLDKRYLISFTNVVFIIFFVRFVSQLIGVIYLSYQKPAMNNLIVTFGNVIALIFLLILKNYYAIDLISCAYILMGIPVLFMILVNFYTFSTTFKNISPSLQLFDLNLLKGLFSLGFSFFIIQVSSVVLFSSSNLLVSHFFSPGEVVVYNTAFTLFQLPTLAYAIVMGPIWSAVTQALAVDDMIWLEKSLKKLNLLSIVFCIGVIVLLCLSPVIYKIWLKEKLIIPIIISISMAVYSCINIFLSPFTNFINGSGKIRVSVLFSIISIIIFIPLAYFLSKIFQSPAAIMFSICIVNGIGIFLQPKQVYKIINKTAEGVWNK